MCGGGGRAPAPPPAPKFEDPRAQDPRYLAIANANGIPEITNPTTIYQIEQTMRDQEQAAFNTKMAEAEQRAAQQRAEAEARAQAQFSAVQAQQEKQFAAAQAAQQQALDRQLAMQERLANQQMQAQAAMQKANEEAALRAQVPQMTNNSSSARRVKPQTSTKERARMAAMGTSQLRVPLSIGSGAPTGGGTGSSPVKLNIGS